MKIKTPNKDYNGYIAGVQFINGEAETENLRLLTWAKEVGFEVETQPEATEAHQSDEINLEEQTVNELKKIAEDKGIEVPKKIKKDDLIKLIREG